MVKIVHNQTEPNKHSRYKPCKISYARWDKRFANIVGVICFFAIFTILNIEVCNSLETNSTNPMQYEVSKIFISALRTDTCNVEKPNKCKLVCRHESDVDLDDEIRKGLELLDTSCNVELEIIALQLPNNRIPENWLNNIGTEIKTLRLKSSPKLLEISNGAFSSQYLKGISKLHIQACGIKTFYKGMFEGMSALGTFVLEYWDPIIEIEVEDNFLTHVTSLSTLQLTKCVLSSDTLRRMTSSVNLGSLEILDLGYNRIIELEANVFDKVPNIALLYLISSAIESIDVKVFKALSKLSLIALQDNGLRTLPKGIFDNILLSSTTNITLQGNPFDCNCDLEWLQEMYLTTTYISKATPPKCGNDLDFETSDFCPNGVTAT